MEAEDGGRYKQTMELWRNSLQIPFLFKFSGSFTSALILNFSISQLDKGKKKKKKKKKKTQIKWK